MSDPITAVAEAATVIPTLQAKIYKWLAIMGVLVTLVAGAYFIGRHDGKQLGKKAMQNLVTQLSQQRADNATGASQRFTEYSTRDRELDGAVDSALAEIRQYYKDHPEQKLVRVPGKKEQVYVPTGNCDSPVLNPDELRLFNHGNKRSDFDSGNSKSVPRKVSGRTP